MKVIDDGVIKYDRTNFTYLNQIPENEYSEIEYWREKLYQLNLIGEEPISHIGFGNISEKHDLSHVRPSFTPQFIITGTQTGGHPKLDGKYYTRVLSFDIDQAKIEAMGPLEASSEALTHGAIYQGNPNIKGIIHIHHKAIWEGILKDENISTDKGISYGTTEMAKSALKLVQHHDEGYFAMDGHEDGVIAYGKNLTKAFELIYSLYLNYASK